MSEETRINIVIWVEGLIAGFFWGLVFSLVFRP